MTVVVSGVGVVLPRARSAPELMAPAAGAPPVEPKDLVGRKGLRYKDRATQLAYCAADAALRDAGLLDDGGLRVPGGSVAMVASSNYGNLDTICRAIDTIAEHTAAAGSAMDLPNASSNVIASSVAIRFGLRGPNLMLCNGATSGLDAVHWAATLIRGGRASRALVLGVEPDNESVRAFTGGSRTIDGAAALVLESEESAAERGATASAVLGDYVRGAGLGRTLERLAETTGDRPALWQLPEQRAAAAPDTLLEGVDRHDLGEVFGLGSGALGVLQCAAAVGWFAQGGAGPVYATAGTDADDASAGIALRGRAAA
ncbi:beta-ketoacyl synthase N-terminal-like domain-containing protein [Streptomyces iranensis]|uniref:3-oxoacyl-[acyl-carrier-protein] synthase II n=1 Tax=Streptomyces iranensis TaxID=576784 RepID=A0A060ZS00_9ACTN|nr:beta-ketoacyl synthase N-terminal-like domain-containing protein [Streptomyces iranensis]MBP2064333.1 3-oxoacyl-[acyl-carrier-protein] synthase II [Streptomyces iranensis]CDR08895.1 Beta-ketoacyl synthase [Streptomyces iranensis]